MKKVTVLLTAGFGVAILTGCQGGNEVMKERYFKTTDGKEVVVTTASKDIEAADLSQNTDVQPQEIKAAEVKAPEVKMTEEKAVRGYEPMVQLESDKIAGISDEANVAGKKSASGQTKEYKVKRGDTLGKIAYRHKVSLGALMQANNLTEADARKLRVGQKLVIPAAGTKAVVKKTAAAVKKAKAVKAVKEVKVDKSALNADGTYTIKRGDSPERIARKFKVKLADLLSANNLDESSSRRLQVGQKLVIPGSSPVSSSVAQSASVAEENKTAESTPVVIPATSSDAPAANTGDMSGNDLAKQLENAAPVSGNAADMSAAEAQATDNIISYVVLEKEISLADFAAQRKTTVEELKRINKKELPEVLYQNFLINVPLN